MAWVPEIATNVSVLSLGLLPLTFGYAIFRYRLMDVDLIFKRGVVYTLAAATVVGLYFGLVAGVAELVHMQKPASGPVGLILAVVVTALLFDPVRKWIQDRVDHWFYRNGLRLSQNVDRIWPRAQFGNRSECPALVGARPAVAHAGGGPDCDLPALRRRRRTVRSGQVRGHEPGGTAGFSFPKRAAAAACRSHVLREHAPGAARDCRIAGSDRQAGSELLHSLPRPADERLRYWGWARPTRAISCRAKMSNCWRRWADIWASPSRTDASTLRCSRRWRSTNG